MSEGANFAFHSGQNQRQLASARMCTRYEKLSLIACVIIFVSGSTACGDDLPIYLLCRGKFIENTYLNKNLTKHEEYESEETIIVENDLLRPSYIPDLLHPVFTENNIRADAKTNSQEWGATINRYSLELLEYLSVFDKNKINIHDKIFDGYCEIARKKI